MAQLKDVQRLIGAYNKWPSGSLKRYSKSYSVITKHTAPALEFIGTGVHSSDVSKLIYSIGNEWAWNVDVKDFKVDADWDYGDDNLFELMWSTLPPLLSEMSTQIDELPLTSDNRAAFALLLQTLLPIYFVKAANISPMVDLMKELMPDFVIQACGEQTDYSASKRTPKTSTEANDSCRGFQARCQSKIHCLALTYNPDADSIPFSDLKNQVLILSQIGEYARCRYNDHHDKKIVLRLRGG